MRHERREPEEVAAEIDRDPRSRARVLERVPPGGVDARRERATVQERPWLVAPERRRRWIEPQHDGVLEELDRDEPDRGVER